MTERTRGAPNGRKTFVLRLDQGLYDAVARRARRECRSVNRQIEFILRHTCGVPGDARPGEEAAHGDARTTAITHTE